MCGFGLNTNRPKVKEAIWSVQCSGGDKTSVKTLTAYISHNKAKDPINLGAK